MNLKADEISKIIREQIGSFAVDVDIAEVGTATSLGDGIARLHGCERAMAGEMLEFPHGVFGIALNLEEDSVGCVLLAADGSEVGEGFHRGAGTPHAEVAALREATQSPHTAVVTLEPCHHTGRTGPCTQALLDAGVRRVVFAQSDPNPVAAGGAVAVSAGSDGMTAISGAAAVAVASIAGAVSRAPDVLSVAAASVLTGRVAVIAGTDVPVGVVWPELARLAKM